MQAYLVTFYRVVLDGMGHDRRVLQSQSIVRSGNDIAAAWEAKAMFCRALGITDWRFRADTCEVAELMQSAGSRALPFSALKPARGTCAV